MIFQIEPEPFEAEVALKQAAIDRARAELHNAELQVARGRELIRTNAIPQSTLDQRIVEQQTAAAALSGAEAGAAAREDPAGLYPDRLAHRRPHRPRGADAGQRGRAG